MGRLAFVLAVLLFAGSAQAQPTAAALAFEDAARVAARAESRIPGELVPYFDTVLYVSKARSGPWAQQMFVFERAGYWLELVDVFAVSTGRERKEKYFTTTPAGIFKLNAERMFEMHRSKTWHNAPMPYAIFLDLNYRTRATGIALHAATGKSGRAALGSRASGGCVRMPLEKIRTLFEDIEHGAHRALVPEFAFDKAAGSTSKLGAVVHNRRGETVLAPGLSILLIVDTYDGAGELAAGGASISGG